MQIVRLPSCVMTDQQAACAAGMGGSLHHTITIHHQEAGALQWPLCGSAESLEASPRPGTEAELGRGSVP